MASMTERVLKAWHIYESKTDHKPSTMRQFVEWAVRDGHLELPEVDPYDILAERSSGFIRSEKRTDSSGRRYRVNHAMRITRGGIQYTFWGVLGFASHPHMTRSFGQRRNQIVDDCFHYKTDVDVYNDMVAGEHPPIPLVLDFTDDVAEREVMERPKSRDNAA
jgi:hypothetical protein